ncbi:DNA polymerase I [Planctomycetes bacterium Pan216]|uniref:DNA polymerase I n=1 Tax=Kolteria novifilia TaxID=2527975 RepID=A0A518BA18_9BACT|nr:DNA polymerase I [Planctomycetes bacterium Pan216]
MAERLYIVDAHSLIYQVFHAISDMTAPDGTPTNAVFGFVRDIQFLRKEKNPDYLVCAFDASGETFRHEIYTDYKANRSEMPTDLRPQIGVIREVLGAYGIPVLSEKGLEADDFLASVAVQAAGKQIEVFICTADKDARQLISDHAFLYDLRRHRTLDRDALEKDWGVRPEQVVDYQAMVGDSTDNVPGIAGVGPKTASQLLQKYGTLDAIFEHLDEIPQKGVRLKLAKGKQSALLSRELVRLKTDIPLPDDWSQWRLTEPDHEALLDLFAKCGFHRFADDIRAEKPTVDTWEANYVAVTRESELAGLLKRLAEATRFSFDLETTSVTPTEAEIVGYAIAFDSGEAFYVAVRGPEGDTELDPDDVLERMRPILENPEIQKVGQNLKYDMIVLMAADVALRGVAFDTMIASYLLEPGERNHNLDELSQRYLNHTTIKISELIGKGKSQKSMLEVPVGEVAPYAGEDADVALRLTEILEPRLGEEKLEKLYTDLECPLIDVLATMEHHGIAIDASRLEQLSEEFASRIETIRAQAFEASDEEFNLDSPLQLRRILFEKLGLPVVKRTKTGPSTDEEVLETLAEKHPLCALIVEYRGLAKLKSTYVDALPQMRHPQTGRVHCSFNQTVAATGRLSSSDPNLQNIPIRTEDGRKIRQAFVPGAKEQALLSADYSQIELRLLADFSEDENLIRAFAEDQDIHAVVAAQIESVSLEDVTKEMRRRAKAVNFGIMYGQSPYGLAKQLKIDQEEAAEFIDAYFDRYPTIETFMTGVLEFARQNGYVTTILGRRRPINGIKRTTGRSRNLPERTAINTVIQGSAADLIKRAMLSIHRRLESEDFGARLLLQIHDELLFEVDADRVDPLAAMVNEEMSQALQLKGVPLKVDIGVGPNWLDLEPIGEVVGLS